MPLHMYRRGAMYAAHIQELMGNTLKEDNEVFIFIRLIKLKLNRWSSVRSKVKSQANGSIIGIITFYITSSRFDQVSQKRSHHQILQLTIEYGNEALSWTYIYLVL